MASGVRSRFLEIGVDRIVDQVVDRNIYTTYMPQIRTLVNETLDVRDEKQGNTAGFSGGGGVNERAGREVLIKVHTG